MPCFTISKLHGTHQRNDALSFAHSSTKLLFSRPSCLSVKRTFLRRDSGAAGRGNGAQPGARLGVWASESQDPFGSDGLGSLGSLGSAIELRSKLQQLDVELQQGRGGGTGLWEQIGGAWVRLPAGMRAWGCVHFMGGAVLGGFPHITYDKYLSKVSDDGGLIIIATPYDLDTNHRQISVEAAACRDQALNLILSRESYSPLMPIFGIGHSLGAKLHVLLASANADTGENETPGTVEIEKPPVYSGHVLVAFNNASAVDTIKVLEKFARALLKERAEAGRSSPLDGLFASLPSITMMAERAIQAAGLEFIPPPVETLDEARRRLRSPFVKMIKFSDDDLDMNEELVEVLEKSAVPRKVTMSELAGNHLTPVSIRLQGGDVNPVLSSVGAFELGDEMAIANLAAMTVRLLRSS